MAEPIIGRSRISPYSFLGRYQQQQKDDTDTKLALRQNQLALVSVNNSLVRVTEQVNVLSTSLQSVSNQIRESSAIDNLKEQQKQRQEKILAENQIREGKENVVEKKIQAALVKPITAIGAKAQGTLFSLTRFFNILLGGFLLNRILTSVSDLSEKGNLTLKNLGDSIIKDLSIIGGIFLGINGGFGVALNIVLRLASLITRIAVRGLLLTPIKIAFNVAGQALRGLASKIRNIPRVPRTPATTTPPSGGSNNRRTTNPGVSAPPSGGGRGVRSARGSFTRQLASRSSLGRLLGIGAGTAGINFLLGEPAGKAIFSGAGSLLPLALGLGFGPLGIGVGMAGAFGAGSVYETFRQPIEQALPGMGITLDDVWSSFTGSAGGNKSLVSQQQGSDVSVMNIGSGANSQNPQEVPAAQGPANILPKISSSNPSNFYTMYSKIKYNVVA